MNPDGLAAAYETTMTEARTAGKQEDASYVISSLLKNLEFAFPNAHLLTNYTDKSEWVFNNAGGAMGSMYIIHASITE